MFSTEEREVSQQVMTFAVLRLDAWLETMRGPGGYGGPVVHWWQDNLLYTGPGLDWRYEGIILGYLNLYQATADDRWLQKARRAGEDLLQGQLPSGNFRCSRFEANPGTGGTPHEAACDMALLALAHTLQARGDPEGQIFLDAARRNLWGYILPVLWDEDARRFRNLPEDPTFVPNKVATIAEALMAWAGLTGEEEVINRYVFPSLDAILEAQVRAPDSLLDGAIEQGVLRTKTSGRYFPFYVARCIPALLRGYERTGREAYRDAAFRDGFYSAFSVSRWFVPSSGLSERTDQSPSPMGGRCGGYSAGDGGSASVWDGCEPGADSVVAPSGIAPAWRHRNRLRLWIYRNT